MRYQRSSFRGHHSLNFLVERDITPKNIAFRVMSLVLQLHLVMMSKYFKFGVDTFNTF